LKGGGKRLDIRILGQRFVCRQLCNKIEKVRLLQNAYFLRSDRFHISKKHPPQKVFVYISDRINLFFGKVKVVKFDNFCKVLQNKIYLISLYDDIP